MSEDIMYEYIKNKIDVLSETINKQFNPSFLFEYLLPQDIHENKHQITMEILPENNINTGEMNYVALTNTGLEDMQENLLGFKKPYHDRDRKRERIRDPLLHIENLINLNDMIPKDKLAQIYFASLGILGIYIFYGLMKKTKMLPV